MTPEALRQLIQRLSQVRDALNAGTPTLKEKLAASCVDLEVHRLSRAVGVSVAGENAGQEVAP